MDFLHNRDKDEDARNVCGDHDANEDSSAFKISNFGIMIADDFDSDDSHPYNFPDSGSVVHVIDGIAGFGTASGIEVTVCGSNNPV